MHFSKIIFKVIPHVELVECGDELSPKIDSNLNAMCLVLSFQFRFCFVVI